MAGHGPGLKCHGRTAIGGARGADIISSEMHTLPVTSERVAAAKPRLTVGLDALLLSQDAGYRNAGLSRYIHQLLLHLPSASPDLNLVAYQGGGPALSDELMVRRPSWDTTAAWRRILWEQLAQPWALHRDRVDLMHAMVNVGPMVHRCPLVVTVHDLTFMRYPELFPAGRRRYLQHMTRWTARHAARVIVDSACTGRDVVELLDVPGELVRVVYPGLTMNPLPAPSALQAHRARHGLDGGYVLFVGTLEPRKNINLLLEAWSLLAARQPEVPTLVIVGGKGWFYESLESRARALGVTEHVRFAGYVAESELSSWYGAANLFVFPSLYEGFGFTPLEAMACGTPVLVSNTSSLPEVVGRAGLSLPPDDPQRWADAIAALMAEPGRRQEMSQRGLQQAAAFPWSETASQTAEVYREVLHNG